jgi:GNAT superfamily N-acetyltransferase
MLTKIVEVDPQGEVALSLLREAALDVRALYSDRLTPSMPPPTNHPLGPRDAYVAAYFDLLAVGCGAFREIDDTTAEARRLYVHRDHRRQGIGAAVMAHLSHEAKRHGYSRLLLETGDRQIPAIRLYERIGFQRIAPFGRHRNDPSSVCYELNL